MQCVLSSHYAFRSPSVLRRTPPQGGSTPNRDMSSFVPARLRSRATPLRMVCGYIATTPFRVGCGPTTTPLLPMMIHPSLAAADLPDDGYAQFFVGHGSKAARRRSVAAHWSLVWFSVRSRIFTDAAASLILDRPARWQSIRPPAARRLARKRR